MLSFNSYPLHIFNLHLKTHHGSSTSYRPAAAHSAADAPGADSSVRFIPCFSSNFFTTLFKHALTLTPRFGWFVGHLTLLFCTFRYSLSYIRFHYYSRWAVFSYRLAFLSAAATYGIVVYKGFRARAKAGQRQPGGPVAMLLDENVQYLLMALVWLYSRQIPLAMLPFSVYSVFHVATYTRANLLPTFYPPTPAAAATGAAAGADKPATKGSGLSETIKNFVKTYYDASMSLVAGLEIALWFRVLISALTFSKGGLLLLIIYTLFFRSRYSQSTFVQGAFHNFAARVDAQVANQSTPPAARQAWHTTKGVVKQIADMTDPRKFAGGPQPAAAKKPQ